MSNGNGRSTEGFGLTREQSAELIVRTCLANGVTDTKQIAYILATAQHETRNFTAPEEDFGRAQARTLGYRGGEEYFGRGYVHLTHKDNYERMDRALGLNGALVGNPSLAKDPQIAASILVIGMRDGMFTGRKLGNYVDADSDDRYNARRTVNGVTASKPWSIRAARDCVAYAVAWEARVPALLQAARHPDGRVHESPNAPPTHPTPARQHVSSAAAILNEATVHFLAGGNRFEYGRADWHGRNDEGNRRTDSSRTEQDLDRDGLKGVDCSSFVWRALHNAGYDVGNSPFATRALFNGLAVTGYSRAHFDVIQATEARRSAGALQPGDILLFKDLRSAGQHVGIFKGYDAHGAIQFVGSQVSTGPAEANAAPGTYWNGDRFEIIGALRAKPEFQVRAPLHGPVAMGMRRAPSSPVRADADDQLRQGEKGPAITTVQQRLADLGYRGKDGKPLGVDGDFGVHTLFALQAFQREHALEGRGVAGPRTEAALDRAERALMSHPSHPQHALYAQVLDRVHAEERAKGIAPGHHSARIAAALAVECLREGITRVDRVELNREVTLVRGVQVSPVRDEPGLNRATDPISAVQASRQTLLESSEQMHQVAVNREAQLREAQQRGVEQRPAAHAPVLAH